MVAALDEIDGFWTAELRHHQRVHFALLPNSFGLGANGQAIPFDGWYEDGLGERIRALCLDCDIDVVFCSYVFQSKLLDFVPSHMLKVIDTHDKMADRYDMLRANGQPLEFFSCTEAEEGAYLRHADLDGLAASLLELAVRPDELSRLAAISRERYARFHADGIAAMRQLFAHPKVLAGPTNIKTCVWPFTFMDLQEDQIYCCCGSWINRRLGTYEEADGIFEIWNSPDAQAIRASMFDGSLRYCNLAICMQAQFLLPLDDILAGKHGAKLKTIFAERRTVVPPPTHLNLCYDRSCNLTCPCCRSELIHIRKDDPRTSTSFASSSTSSITSAARASPLPSAPAVPAIPSPRNCFSICSAGSMSRRIGQPSPLRQNRGFRQHGRRLRGNLQDQPPGRKLGQVDE